MLILFRIYVIENKMDFVSFDHKNRQRDVNSGAPNENIVQNHLNIALLNVSWYLKGRYEHIFIP